MIITNSIVNNAKLIIVSIMIIKVLLLLITIEKKSGNGEIE